MLFRSVAAERRAQDTGGQRTSQRGKRNKQQGCRRKATFTYVARELGKRKIAFICARESLGPNRFGPALKSAFGGVYIANEGFTKESAEQVISSGEADAVAFGKLFIANPDLPERFRGNSDLNAPDPSTFYAPDAEGYTDYPVLREP